MNSHDWAALALAILTTVASFFGARHGANKSTKE